MLGRTNFIRMTISLLALALMMPFTVAYGLNTQLVSQLGGTSRDVATQGHFAYFGMGSKLQIVDLSSTRTQPVIVGTVPLPELARTISVSDGEAYVADGFSGLATVDISNPKAPRLQAILKTTVSEGVGKAVDVVSSGTLAYVADFNAGIQIIDVSNPNLPTLITTFKYQDSSQASSVALTGSTLLVGDRNLVHLIDVTNPSAPRELTTFDTFSAIRNITISGSRAYIAASTGGVQVLDVRNPAMPRWLGTVTLPQGGVQDVATSGTLAFITTGTGGLQIVDLSNPAIPVFRSSLSLPGFAGAVALAGGRALIANQATGLQVVDVTSPDQPALSGELVTVGDATDVAVTGDTALVTDGNGGLQVLSVFNPAAPMLQGTLATPGFAGSVAASGTLAFIGDQTHGLIIADVSHRTQPTFLGAFNTTSAVTNDVAVAGDFAYLVGFDTDPATKKVTGTLRIINVSNPANPWQRGFLSFGSDTAWAVAVSGGKAYVTTWHVNRDGEHCSILQVVDVTNPRFPTVVGSVQTFQDSAADVAIKGQFAYTADLLMGIRVTDVGDPSDPKLAGAYGALSEDALLFGDFGAQSITISDSLAFVGNGANVEVLSLKEPTNPTLRASFTTGGFVNGTAVAGGFIYVADGQGGFYVLKMTDPSLHVTKISRDDYVVDYLMAFKRVYADRDYVFTPPIPDNLQNQLYIQTKNNNKGSSGDDFLSFNVDKPVTVFVGLDDRITSTPMWLIEDKWTKTSQRMTTDDKNSPGHTLYSKNFLPGEVELGGNRNSHTTKEFSQYTVIVTPR